mmetsp:Transcript_2798/g.6099  ORF Transcript_2798/g.6099 Transcript_2798/m.6099 type:complete len:110 (-) Transcript_2798:267-596(-)
MAERTATFVAKGAKKAAAQLEAEVAMNKELEQKQRETNEFRWTSTIVLESIKHALSDTGADQPRQEQGDNDEQEKAKYPRLSNFLKDEDFGQSVNTEYEREKLNKFDED